MLTREEITRCLLRNQLALTAFLCTLTHSFHQAEDLFQDVCMKAINTELSFESEEHLIHWARLTARHRAIDAMRATHGKFESLSDVTLEKVAAAMHSSNYSTQHLYQDALRECLKNLTANSLMILRLRYFEGLTSSSIAKTIDRKVTTVYQSIARIHSSLQACVEKRVKHTEQST